MQLGLIQLLDAFINHREDVVLRKSRYELNKMEIRCHILEGLTNLISQQRIKFLVCEFWPYGLERANGKEKFFKFIKKFSAIYDLAKPRWKDLPPISYEDLEKSYAKMLQETDQSHYPHTDLLCIL